MSSELLYQCSLQKRNATLNHNYQLSVYEKKLIITKESLTPNQKISSKRQQKAFDLSQLTTKISWNHSGKILDGFQICHLSEKTRQIQQKTYRGDHNDLVKLKKVLDGRAFYFSFYNQYILIQDAPDIHGSKIQRCQNKQSGEVKVRKMLPLKKNLSLYQLPNEVEISMKLRSYPHKYILSIDEIYLEEDGIYLIMDHCEGGTLFRYFYNKNFKIPQSQIKQIMKRILKAVHHLHENQIMHRDIKFDNIVLRYDNDIKSLKIIDLGLASEIHKKPQIFCGTPGYIAPEILNGKPYNQLCDVYSLGCLFHSLLSGDRLFPQLLDAEDLMQLNRKNCYKISRKIQDSFAKDLIQRMLNSQNKRPSPLDCLNHPFFQFKSDDSTHSIQDKLKQMDFPMMKNPFNRKPLSA